MNAECTWGDGPDVLVVLDGTPIMAYEHPVNVSEGRTRLDVPKDDEKLGWCTNGFIRQGSFDLTADQALELGHQLISAANRAKELENSIADYFDVKREDCMSEIKKTLKDIEDGKPLKVKCTKMRVPIKNGKEDWDNAEKVSEHHEILPKKDL